MMKGGEFSENEISGMVSGIKKYFTVYSFDDQLLTVHEHNLSGEFNKGMLAIEKGIQLTRITVS